LAIAARGNGDRPSLFRGKLWFWLPWPCLVALDLWSKSFVFAWLAQEYPGVPPELREWSVFRGPISFSFVTWGNTGTIWGLFQNGTAVLVVLRCLAVLVLLWFVRIRSAAERLYHLVLGLVMAGAVGNLYDNFTEPGGAVRDFLRFTGTWPTAWGFPAFNVADSCITVGAIAMVILLWREDAAAARARKVARAAG
jgi:signal peptidase II